MPDITLNSGAAFHAETGISILDAASTASRLIPYSCRSGRCSTCKCKLFSGETTALADETGLTAQEQAEGWILSCVRTATTDIFIQADTLDDVRLPPVRTLPCRIQRLERPTPDVLRVRLRLPPDTVLEALPGQYIEIIGNGGLRRSYSLANICKAGKPLELHVRAVNGGAMSAYWFDQARENDLLRLHGPLGTFLLRDAAQRDLYFLATGTGIAPILALLESLPTLATTGHPRSVTVLWGGRTPQDLYHDVANNASSNLTFIPVISGADPNWNGARGHVQDVLLADSPDLSHAAVYACGSDAMIHSARASLLAAGLPGEHFHSDAFVCSAAPSTQQGP
ncbi:2Fe-2S iron-sulfur cluster-binding protein [Thermomonas sp.]|uniref:2Fe-2S iron-sulfur cluster-binding protein n=1 Tax=Thermomonas sp. TaxID=1971895 RepID=UPI0035B2A172